MEFVRFASAAGPDARRRDAVDAGVSAKRGNAADGAAPPQSVRMEFHTSLLKVAQGELVDAELTDQDQVSVGFEHRR